METIPKLLSYSKPNVGELKSVQKWIHNRLLDECQGTSRNRRDIWSLSDCNGIRTHNHLVRKRTLNYLMKLTEWVRIPRIPLQSLMLITLLHILDPTFRGNIIARMDLWTQSDLNQQSSTLPPYWLRGKNNFIK